MVFQIAAAAILPIVLLIVAAPPFDEPIEVQPSNPAPENNVNDYFVFFILWAFWILILTRIIYKVGKQKFRIKRNLNLENN